MTIQRIIQPLVVVVFSFAVLFAANMPTSVMADTSGGKSAAAPQKDHGTEKKGQKKIPTKLQPQGKTSE